MDAIVCFDGINFTLTPIICGKIFFCQTHWVIDPKMGMRPTQNRHLFIKTT